MTKKRIQIVLQIQLLVAVCLGGTNVMAQQVGGREMPKRVGVVAHRGFYKYEGSAENTLSAMQNAVDHDLAGTEFDMQLTGDGVAIVFHDNMLSGLPIGETPYSEVMENPAATLSNGERIPTLEEFAESYTSALAQQSVRDTVTRLFFEIKVHPNDEKIALSVATAIEAVKQWSLEKVVCFISFSLPVCKEIVSSMPGATVAYLGGDIPPCELKAMGINSIDYNYKVLQERPEWVKEARRLGMEVNVWTVNDKDTALRMKELGVDLITTDLPLDMVDWLED